MPILTETFFLFTHFEDHLLLIVLNRYYSHSYKMCIVYSSPKNANNPHKECKDNNFIFLIGDIFPQPVI